MAGLPNAARRTTRAPVEGRDVEDIIGNVYRTLLHLQKALNQVEVIGHWHMPNCWTCTGGAMEAAVPRSRMVAAAVTIGAARGGKTTSR